jgi:hypothetical protein
MINPSVVARGQHEAEYPENGPGCQGQSPQKGLYGEKGLWFNTNPADR